MFLGVVIEARPREICSFLYLISMRRSESTACPVSADRIGWSVEHWGWEPELTLKALSSQYAEHFTCCKKLPFIILLAGVPYTLCTHNIIWRIQSFLQSTFTVYLHISCLLPHKWIAWVWVSSSTAFNIRKIGATEAQRYFIVVK